MLYQVAVLVVLLINYVEGTTLAAMPGEDKTLQWTMNPVPPSSAQVTVLHPTRVPGGKQDFATLFSVLGTTVLRVNTDIGRRVTNTVNTNTVIGHIEFTLNGITADDAGDYRARYRPDSGAYPTDYVGVRLIVYVKPSDPIITEEAAPVVGRTMVLNCSTTSNSKPDGHGVKMNYKWYMNGADIPSHDVDVTSETLEMPNVQTSDEDTKFMCVVFENITISSNATYTVQVKYGPSAVSPNKMQQYTLVEKTGTLGPIKCSANCEPACEYQWKFNGVNHGFPGDPLTINNILRTSTGTYWCLAFNDYGSNTSKNITLDVYYKPDTPKLSKSRDGDIMENESFILTCTTDSVPLPDIIITSSFEKEKQYISNKMLNSTLKIQKPDCLDTGKYVCNANNTIGRTSSNPVMVNVTCAPHLDGRRALEKFIYVRDDGVLNIKATIIANPPATLSWIFINDTYFSLENNTNGFVYYEDVRDVAYRVRAVISQMKSGDYGRYILKASNSIGFTHVTFNVFSEQGSTPETSSLPLQDQSIFKAGFGMIVVGVLCLGVAIVLTIYNLRRIRSSVHQSQKQSHHYDDIPSGTRSESAEQENAAYVEMDHQRNDTYEGLGTRENTTMYDKLKPGGQQTETSGTQCMNTMLH